MQRLEASIAAQKQSTTDQYAALLLLQAELQLVPLDFHLYCTFKRPLISWLQAQKHPIEAMNHVLLAGHAAASKDGTMTELHVRGQLLMAALYVQMEMPKEATHLLMKLLPAIFSTAPPMLLGEAWLISAKASNAKHGVHAENPEKRLKSTLSALSQATRCFQSQNATRGLMETAILRALVYHEANLHSARDEAAKEATLQHQLLEEAHADHIETLRLG